MDFHFLRQLTLIAGGIGLISSVLHTVPTVLYTRQFILNLSFTLVLHCKRSHLIGSEPRLKA